MVNLVGVDNKEINLRDYLEEIKFEKAIDNQYYKLLLFNYKLKDSIQENFSKKLIPKYAFCIVENNINMPIENYFKIRTCKNLNSSRSQQLNPPILHRNLWILI